MLSHFDRSLSVGERDRVVVVSLNVSVAEGTRVGKRKGNIQYSESSQERVGTTLTYLESGRNLLDWRREYHIVPGPA